MTFPRTGALIDTLRLASGLTLFTFALFHFLNHALGLWSLDAMAAFQGWRLAVTRSAPGAFALALALVVHLTLAFLRIARMKTWALPRVALWQLASGVLIGPLLLPHFFEAGVGPREVGRVMSYPAELGLLWPGMAVTQSLLLLVVWVHGCIGLHQWLKSETWWRRNIPALAAVATLVPAAALAGFLVAGREVERLKAAQAFPLPYPASELPVLQAHAAAAGRASFAVLALAVELCARERRGRARAPAARHLLRARPEGADRAGPDPAGDQPRPSRAASLGLRRQGALLDLPREGA